MQPHQLIIILDFGAQYRQLIARRVREAHIYCEVLPHDTPLHLIQQKNPIGIIFTGGPSVVYEQNAPKFDSNIFNLGIPILGICYGAQLMGYLLGGKIERAEHREYGKKELYLANLSSDELFADVPAQTTCWMSHTYHIVELPSGFQVTAATDTCPIAAMANFERQQYAVQFHPEVIHTPYGTTMLHNFLFRICQGKGDWQIPSFADEKIAELRQDIGDKIALCALSGGVDSSVAALLLHRAIGKQLVCIFVDHGLMRKGEADEVERVFTRDFDLNFIRVDASQYFLQRLKGVTDPEQKRKIIGEAFIRIFEEQARKIGSVDFLVQGTIYADVIESGSQHTATIKSHHNVGGLPDVIAFSHIVEPLRDLFKDEVRELGRVLQLPPSLTERQPFPGPGLAIRIIGEVTPEKLHILRETDHIYRAEIAQAGLAGQIWQYFTVFTGLQSVGVMGDERTYGYTIALRAVTGVDGMTADWARLPYEVLERISNRIINEVPQVNRVVYDITSKPPATIEWE